ncbi:MAG: hypothetical protein ACJ74W_16870 [Pyrinomonadaceae bacterium]
MKAKSVLSLLVFVLMCAVLPSALAQKAPPANTPDALVRDLYRVHNNGRGPVFQPTGKRYWAKYFDDTLAGLLRKALTESSPDEVGPLDFDPLYNAQDTKITNFQVGQPKITQDQATVIVSFRNFGQMVKITFRLRNMAAGWRIANVDYGADSDLVKILSVPE